MQLLYTRYTAQQWRQFLDGECSAGVSHTMQCSEPSPDCPNLLNPGRDLWCVENIREGHPHGGARTGMVRENEHSWSRVRISAFGTSHWATPHSLSSVSNRPANVTTFSKWHLDVILSRTVSWKSCLSVSGTATWRLDNCIRHSRHSNRVLSWQRKEMTWEDWEWKFLAKTLASHILT